MCAKHFVCECLPFGVQGQRPGAGVQGAAAGPLQKSTSISIYTFGIQGQRPGAEVQGPPAPCKVVGQRMHKVLVRGRRASAGQAQESASTSVQSKQDVLQCLLAANASERFQS